MSSEVASATSRRNRAYWRSRRGLLELDLLLPPFATACFDRLTPPQQAHYEALLECEDQDIWDWLQGRSEPDDPALRDLIVLIRVFNDGAVDRTR